MITVPQNETNEARPVVSDTQKRCQYCCELATTQDEHGIPLCGIPGNHPEYDEEKILN